MAIVLIRLQTRRNRPLYAVSLIQHAIKEKKTLTELFILAAKLKPFQIRYVTDGAETNDDSNNGFCLNYVQF